MKEQDQENSFEKQLRQKAADFRLKPSDDVWNNVKISLQDDKRKHRFLWLWAAAIGLLVGAGSTAWYFMNSAASTGNSSTPIITNNTPIEKEQATVTDLALTKKENTSVNAADEVQPQPATRAGMAEQDRSVAETSIVSQEKSVGGDATNKMKLAENDSNSDHKNSAPSIIETATANNLSAVENRSNETAIEALKKEMLPLISFSSDPENIAWVPSLPQSLMPQESSFVLSRFSIGAEVVPLISFIKYGTQNLSSPSATADVAFVDSISKLSQSSGKPLIGFSAGINGQFGISEMFALNAGIHFTQTGEKNSFLQVGSIEMFSDTSSVTSAGGATSNAANYEFSTGNIETTSRYNWLDLSVNGEWHFYKNRSNQISVFAGAGVSHFLSYTFSAEGLDKATLQNNALFSNQQDPPVFHAYQFTTATGINYRWLISDHISLLAGFQFHYYLSSITLNDIPVTAHPYWLGINTGVSYRF